MANTEQLAEAIAKLNKVYGAGTVIKLDDGPIEDVKVVSSGAVTLDRALGVGGIPKGRITEIYGPEAAGKTTLALTIAANIQKEGGDVAFIDVEHAIDFKYAEALGVNVHERFHLSQPDTAEQALEIAEVLVRAGVECIVIDSVAALVPQKEVDGEMQDQQMGLQARLMGKALRKLIAPIAENETVFIFINQLRSKVGIVFGSSETTPGGRALPYAASVRIDVRKKEQIKATGDMPVGNEHYAKVVKNKVASPHGHAEFDIYYGKGIDWYGSLIAQALLDGVLVKSGSFIKFNGETLGQGKHQVRERLVADFAVTQLILDAVETRRA